MITFDDDLPTPVSDYQGDFYGPLATKPGDTLFVVHYAVMDPGPAKGLAAYGHSNGSGYRWHRSIGSDGSCYRSGHWNEEGAHDSGINTKSVGAETTAKSGTQMRAYPKLMNALARECADFCHWSGRAPSRDFIIGHYEDEKFGGDSTHTDPTPGWDWGEFMALVALWYAKGEEDMTEGQAKMLTQVNGVFVGMGKVWKGSDGKPLLDVDHDGNVTGSFQEVGKAFANCFPNATP